MSFQKLKVDLRRSQQDMLAEALRDFVAKQEAARAFPTTSNVAASLRLAVNPKVPVCVRVVAVPGGQKNVHEIRVQGEFGSLTAIIENVPSKENPRTSQLAAYSAVATLANLTRALRVGS